MKKNAKILIAILTGSVFMPKVRKLGKDDNIDEKGCGCGEIDLSQVYDEGDYEYEDDNTLQDDISEYSTDSESESSIERED